MNSWDAFPGPKVVYTDPSARVAPLTKLRHDNGPELFRSEHVSADCRQPVVCRCSYSQPHLHLGLGQRVSGSGAQGWADVCACARWRTTPRPRQSAPCSRSPWNALPPPATTSAQCHVFRMPISTLSPSVIFVRSRMWVKLYASTVHGGCAWHPSCEEYITMISSVQVSK